MKLWIKYNAGVDNFAHFVENLVKTVDKYLFSVEKPVDTGTFWFTGLGSRRSKERKRNRKRPDLEQPASKGLTYRARIENYIVNAAT